MNAADEDAVQNLELSTRTYRYRYPGYRSQNNNNAIVDLDDAPVPAPASVPDANSCQWMMIKVFYKDFYIIRSGEDGFDYTGVRVWPGAELLAYYIISISKRIAQCDVIELGCGVGLTGLLASKFASSAVLTDREQVALDLLDHAIVVNKSNATTAKLEWGLQQACELKATNKNERFDVVFGADIVYPDTSNDTLDALFETANVLLKSNDDELGTEVLSDPADAGSALRDAFICAYVPRSESTTERFFRTAYKKGWSCTHIPTASFVNDDDRTSQINAGLVLIFRRMSTGDDMTVPWLEQSFFSDLCREKIREELSDTEETCLAFDYSIDSDENANA